MLKFIPILFMQFPDSIPLQEKKKDVIPTSEGDLEITFVGHGTLMFSFKGKIIHVDPCSRLTDYSNAPKADLLLITHDHPDHLDVKAIDQVRTDKTMVVVPEKCADRVTGSRIMKNGDTDIFLGLIIEAVPAYNIIGMREGRPYHPKGEGNGYVIAFGDKRIYVAGDTENIPEVMGLKDIDIAFLPMNLPTMSLEMLIDAAEAIKPGILYPYHFSGPGGSDVTEKMNKLLENIQGIDVRIR